MPQPSVTKLSKLPFIELQSVDSTNNYAFAQIHAGLAHDRMTFFTHEQVAGKGQKGKTWLTEKGANILLSMVIKPHPLQVSQQFLLSACTAVAVHDFFVKYAGDDTRIKWPNDLYWQDRKAGGILIESIIGTSRQSEVESGEWKVENGKFATTNNWKWAVAGVGININQAFFPADLPNPVSLKQITGKNFDILLLAQELALTLDRYYGELMTHGPGIIHEQYLSHLYKKNEIVKLKKGTRVFEALIKTVLPTGQLIVQHAMEEAFDFGEVEWVR